MRFSGVPILPQQVREQLPADGHAHPIEDDQEDRAVRGERGDDLVQEPLDRYQPVLCRIRFRPGPSNSRELPRSSLSQLGDTPEEFSIGLGKFTDRVARAKREPSPIDGPAIGQVAVLRLHERTRL